MLWEIRKANYVRNGWTGWCVHANSSATKEEALQKAICEDGPVVIDVRWTCEEGHSYFVRGSKPIFKNEAGEIIDTTIWEIKDGKVQAEYTGREYEIECYLCSDKYFTNTDLDPNRPLHPLCVKGEHIWDIPCQACHPGEIHCGRRPFCGTIKSTKDFHENIQ